MEVVNTKYGKLIASRNDVYLGRSLFEYGEFSEGEVELFKTIITKEMVVCDVGANIGAHTLVFSQLAKLVHAFEPNRYVFNALAGMVALNELKNVRLYQCGIGEKEDVMAYVEPFTEGPNNFGSHELVPPDGEHNISIFPLETPCNFLKVDVEGMELEVLKGAEKMIRSCQPFLYVENDREPKADELIRFVRYLGYTPYWHCPPFYNEDNFYGKKENLWPKVCSINMACIPSKFKIKNLKEAKEGEWSTMFAIAPDWKAA